MEDLLPYFERELMYLRRLGREFHERYPRVGSALQLSDDTCPDPHIEQLIQSVALLSARVAKRLDDSYPELTEALLEALFPHYLRPFPSCAIVCATYPSIKSAGEAPVLAIPRGTEMDSGAVDGVRCSFKTAYPIALSPVTLAAARFDAVIRAPSSLALPASASAALSIVLEGAVPAKLPFLRIFIDGEPSFCAALRDALFTHAVCAYVEAEPGHWTPLAAVPLAPVGFAEDEALIPFDARSHVAYRVLSEYFVFPEKFNFFDIDLAALRPLLPQECRRFTLHVALAGLRPDSARTRMLASLSETNLLLGCSPVVNLFQRPGQPISVTQLTADYAVMADAAHAKSFEVYSIDSVKMVRRRGQKEVVTEFRPFYSLRHGEEATAKNGHYWMLRHDAELAALSPGHEKRITLIDGDFNPMEVEKTSLSIALSCTNSDLPNSLKYGQAGGDLTPLRDADSYSVRLLRRPTRTCRFPKGSQQWRLISHLTVNHHALSQGGLPALREILALYDLPQSPISRRQIEGITDLKQVAAVTWMRHKHGAALVHGTEIRMTVDEEAFVGSGLLLFVEVIDQFLGLYVQVNSFIELVILSKQSDKELIRCKPRSGYLKLA
ncbi:type VI secretion system baseplate subunit TssF [Janthinobacterium sp. SUN118]|uniref:type VI secretion system baseplate subunit TssF n=1 Tax=Janthinobacterium sp. SUN118 TaxID=3004100 RepID=UPI0025B18474|nr:type VI secretion system baseplate subunit TssF [Janthinobacterium sp. SUN118]MDN2711622.1 type VI secretion system baseplate subunit TssF [Janthinobacterium sp. SUN118]